MRFTTTFFLRFYVLLSTWPWSTLAILAIGIERDYGAKFGFKDPDGIQSYSTIIGFHDKSIPGDASKMSDAQFVNLAAVAYEEIVALWSAAQLPRARCPMVVVVLESEGNIYFASSLKNGNSVELSSIDENVRNSVGWLMNQSNRISGRGHRNRGGCAEPNVLRLYGHFHHPWGTSDVQTYQAPPKVTGTSPRMAAFRRVGKCETNSSPRNIAPLCG